MPFWQRTNEGYLMVDHRASPGLPEDIARLAGYDPAHCKEGKFYETATLHCTHCGCTVVKNPFRVRERAHCLKCNNYICDFCDAARQHSDYVHRPIEQVSDIVQSGNIESLGPVPLRSLTEKING